MSPKQQYLKIKWCKGKHTAAFKLYLLSTTVSRKKKLANTAIENAAAGIFP
jgi:hypothetical protein